MSPTSGTDDSQTWAIRPVSQAESLGLFPDLPPGVAGRSQDTGSSYTPLSQDYGSGDDDEGTDTLRVSRHRQKQPGRHQLAYKPSFSKPTFQWMRGELLGKGSYGRVYLALNATTGEIMAVKQVELPKTASDKANSHQLDVMKALKFESDTLKDLDHPNIVQYLGFEESQDFLSIFLEYVPGGTISALIHEHGRLREEVTTSFLSQILSGLEYLHSKNILHRDLKADNILVEPTGVCKISDFGISKKANDLHQGGRAHTMMRGTVYWMAPEVVSSTGQGYDVKVDIWGVGCIALEMWSGSRPWSDLPMMPVMFKLFTEKLPPPVPSEVHLSEQAEDFRLQCFHADPQKRPHARVLRKHPYLKIREGWSFDITDVADSDKPPRPPPIPYAPPSPDKSRSSKGIPPRQEHASLKASRVPPKPPTSKPPLAALKIPEYRPPRATSSHDSSQHLSRERSRRPVRTTTSPASLSEQKGPRIVTITPPGSPKPKPGDDGLAALSAYGMSSASSAPYSARRGKTRRLIVINPDTEPQPTFVYTPPPLPDAHATPSAVSPSFKADTPTLYSNLTASGTSPPPSSSLSSAGPELSPVPSSASVTRSPRPLPPSPAAPIPMPSTSLSFKSAYPPPRFPVPPVPSSSRHDLNDLSNTAYRAAHVQRNPSTGTVNGKSIRRLPISPPRLKTSISIAHLPSAGSRSLMKQKSVPDVSIFAYDRPSTSNGKRTIGSGHVSSHRSFSMDSDAELDAAAHAGPTTAPVAPSHSSGRALPDPQKYTAERLNSVKSPGEIDHRMTMRPKPEEVYDHLESWFPHHDLDQPLDGSALTPIPRSPQTPSSSEQHLAVAVRQRKEQSRKSIKMIAKEQCSRSDAAARRRTRLWNSYVKELK